MLTYVYLKLQLLFVVYYYLWLTYIIFKAIIFTDCVLILYDFCTNGFLLNYSKYKHFFKTNDAQACINYKLNLFTLILSLIIFIKKEKFKSLKFFCYLFIFYWIFFILIFLTIFYLLKILIKIFACMIFNKNLDIFTKSFDISPDSGYITCGYKPLKLMKLFSCLLTNLNILSNYLSFKIIYIFLNGKNKIKLNKLFFNKLSIKLVTGFSWYLFPLVFDFYFFKKNRNNPFLVKKKKLLYLKLIVGLKKVFIDLNIFYYVKIIEILVEPLILRIIIKNRSIRLNGTEKLLNTLTIDNWTKVIHPKKITHIYNDFNRIRIRSHYAIGNSSNDIFFIYTHSSYLPHLKTYSSLIGMHYDKYNVLQKQYVNLSMLEELYKDNSKIIISNNIIQSVWEQNNFQDPRCFTGANCKLNYVLNKLEQNIVITFDKDFKDSLRELPNNHTIKSISDLSDN